MQQAMYLPCRGSHLLNHFSAVHRSSRASGGAGLLRLALDHHGRRLEDGHRDLSHGQLLVVGLLGRDDRSIGREHEVDARVRHQVRLELRDVHVQGSIEAKAGRQGTDDLGDQAVQIGVRGALNVQVPEMRPHQLMRAVLLATVYGFMFKRTAIVLEWMQTSNYSMRRVE